MDMPSSTNLFAPFDICSTNEKRSGPFLILQIIISGLRDNTGAQMLLLFQKLLLFSRYSRAG